MNDNSDNKLIRVDWQGMEQASGMFDTSGRVTAFLEFQKSLHAHIPALKQTFQSTIYLQPLMHNGEPDTKRKNVVPTHFKSKFQADDTLVLGFAPYNLEPGVCYKLTIIKPKSFFGGTSLHSMVNKEFADLPDMKVCTSSCNCDVLGTRECVEDHSGEHVCVCHPHFTGPDCSQCEPGFYRNIDGFCEKDSLCVYMGGSEDCNKHGECYQEGQVAICLCDEGFTHDGLDQCGRCSDPLMAYPNECHKTRNWVLQQEDYICEHLMHVMPHDLYKDPHANSNGGLDN